MQSIKLNKLKIHCWWKTKLAFFLPLALVISFLWVPSTRAELPYYEGVELTVSEHPSYQAVYMTYDSFRDKMIAVTRGDSSETWFWDGTNWSNANVSTPAESAAIIFDSHRGVAVLYVPTDGLEPGETWEWDGTSWQLVDTNGPTSRYYTGMAYDENRQVTVLFGGHYINQGAEPAYTWEWDGSSWSVYDTQGQGITRGYFSSMAYDANRDVVVFYDEWTNLTATWDGQSWDVFDTGGSGPPPDRIDTRLVYDRRRESVILFGGGNLNDLWEWDGQTWTELDLDTPPPPRSHHGMAYDSTRNEVLIFGGTFATDPYNVTFLFDTWALRIREVWMDYSHTGTETGDFDTPFNTLLEAVDETAAKGIIDLKPGTGNESLVITKPLWLKAPLGPVVIQGE